MVTFHVPFCNTKGFHGTPSLNSQNHKVPKLSTLQPDSQPASGQSASHEGGIHRFEMYRVILLTDVVGTIAQKS